jgi:dihydroorotase
MTYHIKNATILHKGSALDGKKRDLIIANGIIKEIGSKLSDPKAKVIEGKGLHVCIGLCDIGTHTGEPGREDRETMQSLTSGALKGGYTCLAIFPNNQPITQSKADVQFLKRHPQSQGVEIHAIGALSIDTKGANITEYIDMHTAGAIAFSDGMKAVQDAGLLSRALTYADQIGGLIIHHPNDKTLSAGGEMHEGEMSTNLGMKGVPSIAESSMVQRDILVADYTGGKLLLHCLSAEQSLTMVKTAKKSNPKLYTSVDYMHVIHIDKDLVDFDTHLKVIPVLRDAIDRKAIIKAINDDVIDIIVTNHTPLDVEVKNLEFTYAEPGAIGLETCLPALLHHAADKIALEKIIHKLTISPRQILGLNIPKIAVGEKANLCIFDINADTVINADDIASISKNSPYIDKVLKGKVVATIV